MFHIKVGFVYQIAERRGWSLSYRQAVMLALRYSFSDLKYILDGVR